MKTRFPLALFLLAVAAPCWSAAPEATAGSTDKNLTVDVTRYAAECPPSKQTPCVIAKPFGSGYRILSSDVGIDDTGEQWILDFTKLKSAKPSGTVLRILGANGELHEINITFGPAPAKKKTPDKATAAKAPPKTAAKPAEKSAEKSPAKEAAKPAEKPAATPASKAAGKAGDAAAGKATGKTDKAPGKSAEKPAAKAAPAPAKPSAAEKPAAKAAPAPTPAPKPKQG